MKKLGRQFLKLRRNRWERFQNSSRSNIIYNYKGIFKIRLYKDSYLSEEIYDNRFEPNECQFIFDFLKRDDTFIDIGTNIGLYSLMAAKKVGPAGKVYSFEPVRKTYERFVENIELNNFRNIIPVRKALSDVDGVFEINTSCDGFDGWNSFARITRGTKSIKEKVETLRVDSIFKDAGVWNSTALIKIDVEGWEKFVLKGGEILFKQPESPTLLIEFVDQNTANAGYSCKELYELIESYGFNLYNIGDNSIYREVLKEHYEYTNLIATKNIQKLMNRLPGWAFFNY